MPERIAGSDRTSGTSEEETEAPLALQLLGSWEARVQGRPMPPLRSRKGQWLLALLLLQGGRSVEREWLAGLLWPDSSTAQALYNLRRNLTDLRDALGPEAHRLQTPTPRTLRLDLAGAEVDVHGFDAVIAAGDHPSLERAVQLYRGPLLVECMEEWITPERTAREQAYLGALETLAGEARASDDREAEGRYLRRTLAVDPLRESAQQALMEALAAQGDLSHALRVYHEYRELLHRETSAAPGPEITALFAQIRARARGRERRLSPPASPSRTPAPERAGAVPLRQRTGREEPARRLSSRLPHPVSSFVGRAEEVREIAARLTAGRLVTLTGPGGVGKTRLAIEVAHALAEDHLNGVWFVDLTRLSDPALVPQVAASTLGVQEQPDQPLIETLAEFLQPRQLLLILDNCEHLLAACAELVDALLSHSPALRVLATSRQSLGVTGEVAWPLAGLSVPPAAGAAGWAGGGSEERAQGARSGGAGSRGDVGGGVGVPGRSDGLDGSDESVSPNPQTPVSPLSADAATTRRELSPHPLLQFEAVRLFVERATAAAPSFSLTERSGRSVGEICRRLEGIPLALELAAARLKALSVEEIAARLDDSFRLLTGGSRTAQPRQQTLRAAMDWSYELLSEPEQLLLQRLAVFAGSFSLNAVEAVCGDVEVLDLLTQLADKSLVVVDGAREETRYRLLETVRQYALERLQTGAMFREAGGPAPPPSRAPGGSRANEEESVRRRHLEFYLRLAEEARPHIWGQDPAAWLERLETEIANLRAALDWALARAPQQALRLANELVGFWVHSRYLEEGRQRLAAALERVGPARRSSAGAWALTHLGNLAGYRDDFAAARAFLEESLALWRELSDPAGIAYALSGLGTVARRQEQYAESRAFHEESLAARRALGDRHGIAQSLIGLADTLQEQGADPSAWAGYYEEALAIRREMGDRQGVATALGQLANVAWRQGDHAQARRHREESLALWRAMGSRPGVIHSLGALGHLARDQGAYEDARAYYTESLQVRQEFGDLYTLIQALEDFAELAAAEGEWARMTRLFGAAEAQRQGMANPLQPRERAEYERYLSQARTALGEAAVAAAWEAGQAMPLEQAILSALQEPSDV